MMSAGVLDEVCAFICRIRLFCKRTINAWGCLGFVFGGVLPSCSCGMLLACAAPHAARSGMLLHAACMFRHGMHPHVQQQASMQLVE